MPTPSFDLIDIIKTIQKKRRFIITVIIIAGIVGGVFYGVKKKKYRAEARFLVNNPLYGDRNTLFRSIETRYVDYFGGDDDLDKVTALLGSDTVKDRIIRNCQFQIVYNADINLPKTHAYLMYIFEKNFNLKRTEYKDMTVSYIAYDPQTAANVTNMAVKVLDEMYIQYYSVVKDSINGAIQRKISELNKGIDSLTDILGYFRDTYGIYDIISPTRQNLISSELKIENGKNSSGKPLVSKGKAMEEIQNIESIKDQFVIDRAHYISLLNEFSVSANSNLSYIKVITRALPPVNPYGPSLILSISIAISLGLLFSVGFVLLNAYYKLLISIER